jgi:hypothetical protein
MINFIKTFMNHRKKITAPNIRIQVSITQAGDYWIEIADGKVTQIKRVR